MTSLLQPPKSLSCAPLREGTSDNVRHGNTNDFSRLVSPSGMKNLEVHDKAIAAIIHPSSSNDTAASPDESRSTAYSEAQRRRVSSVRGEDIRRISVIGAGRFCKVHLAAVASGLLQKNSLTNERYPHLLVAVKSINPYRIKDDSDFVVAAGDLANEAKILSRLNHKNIIRLQAVCSDSFSESFCTHGFFLVLEVLRETLCDRLQRWRRQKNKNEMSYYNANRIGCTSSFLPRILSIPRMTSRIFKPKLPKGDFSETTSIANDVEPEVGEHTRMMYHRVQETAVGIADGLDYLHSNGIVLRDLKPANIGYEETSISDVYDGDKSIDSLRLFDFGMARHVERCDPLEICGSLRYMAPEVLAGKGYSLKVDVYSFGIVLFEICSLRRPFAETFKTTRRQNKILRKLQMLRSPRADVDKRVEIFHEQLLDGKTALAKGLHKTVCCPKVWALIEDCCAFDPTKRPTFSDIRSRLASIFKKD